MNLSFGKFAVKSDIPIIMLVSDDSLFSINGFFSLGTVITHISLRQNNHHHFKNWRCRWDSNPRWPFSTLLAFQASPLNLLGTATYSYFYYNLSSYIFQEISKEKTGSTQDSCATCIQHCYLAGWIFSSDGGQYQMPVWSDAHKTIQLETDWDVVDTDCNNIWLDLLIKIGVLWFSSKPVDTEMLSRLSR